MGTLNPRTATCRDTYLYVNTGWPKGRVGCSSCINECYWRQEMSEVSGGVIVVSVWLVVICWDRTWNKAYLLLQRTLDVGRWQLLLQTHISYPFTHSSFPQGVGRFVHQRSKYIEWESWQKDRQVHGE